MNEAFLEAYDRELALLYERGRQFAEDYPLVAERLGGILRGNVDPGVAGLLEGAAFLAARVQLKLQAEFGTFTTELLEQVLPGALVPQPTAILIEAEPDPANDALAAGQRLAAGAMLAARYTDRDTRMICRFRLAAPLVLWPLRLRRAALAMGPGAAAAAGIEPLTETAAVLTLALERPPAETGAPAAPVSDIACDALKIHLAGDPGEAAALYEALTARALRITLRHEDAEGNPRLAVLPPDAVEPAGFAADETLFPEDAGVFNGFTRLREWFVFPQKFAAVRLTGLAPALARVGASRFDLVIELSEARPALAPRIGARHFRLHAAPAVNLFEDTAQVRLDTKRSEYLIVPEAGPPTHVEVHRVLSATGHRKTGTARVPVLPLYGPRGGEEGAAWFTTRRRPRPAGTADYAGSEMLIAVHAPPDEADALQRLQLRTLVSNRHLAALLPFGQQGSDLVLDDDTSVPVRCIAGPSAPRDCLVALDDDGPQRPGAGRLPWRLISALSLNLLGLGGRAGGEADAAALRETLALFADPGSAAQERQIAGLRSIATRPVTRTIRRAGAHLAARGLEITLTFDERAFEGSGIVLFGAVLDRFVAEYAPVNTFTQTVIASTTRGRVKAWPPRTGAGPLL